MHQFIHSFKDERSNGLPILILFVLWQSRNSCGCGGPKNAREFAWPNSWKPLTVLGFCNTGSIESAHCCWVQEIRFVTIAFFRARWDWKCIERCEYVQLDIANFYKNLLFGKIVTQDKPNNPISIWIGNSSWIILDSKGYLLRRKKVQVGILEIRELIILHYHVCLWIEIIYPKKDKIIQQSNQDISTKY
jgi:hypothetical protein